MASSHSSSELRNLSQATVSDESIYEESFRRHVDSDEEAAASEQIQKELTESFLKSSITPTERIGLNGTVLADVGSNAKSRVHHLIRDLPQQPLCPEVFPPRLLQLPAALRWECLRAARAYEISLQSLSDASIRTPEDLYQHLTSCDPGRVFGRTSWKTWEQCQVLKDDVNFIFKGSLSFNDAKGQALFNVKLNPLKLDKLSRVQRKFGAKRFLFLDIPSLTKTNVPKPFDGHKTDLGQKFLEWLLVEKTFLGWRWNISTVQPIKQKSSASKKSVFERRAIFFATEGEGLKSISMQALYDWVIPLAENSYQSHCKAFTRLDLMLSQTIPTVVLEPSQVEFVDDILADGSEGSAEYLAFNDTRLRWKLSFDRNKPAIMTDGCGLMSPGMAKKICKELGIVGNRPVSFQGRINGCKGMWTISAPYDSTDPKAQEIRIEIRDSQKKVIPRPADLDPATCEAGRWTFELLRHSAPCRPAALHIDFMPILEDRGIARETIRQVIKTQLDLDFEEFMSAIDDPLKLRRWLHARNALFEKGDFTVRKRFQRAGLSFVAGQVQQIAQMWLNSMREKLKIRLGKSIFAYGIADHTGCLQEGEIHFAFSESFHDKHTGDPCTHLKGEVLVARHPALRRSDMQKVRAVYKEELSHLTDIVVFSSKGSQPEAAKLQGGDYDGDTFWLCWEPKLTRQFWNAPAPFEPANVAKFGIRVDKRKVKDLPGATTDERIHTWVSENLKFRLQDDLLGRITKEHERVAYHDRSLHSRNVNDLADLHDLVIDSAKNGYSFSDADFREFRTKLGLKGELTRPEYEKFFGATSEGNEGVLPRPPVAKDGTKHITDEMLFDVVNPRISKVEDKLTAIVKTTPTADADLDFEYHRLTQKHTSRSGEVVTRILSQLKIDLQKPYQHYYRHFNPGAKSSLGDRYVPIVEECYRMYTDIQLCETDNSTVDDWLEPRLSHEPTTWALLKALTLYAHHGDRHAKFVFLMAGRELCWVKAHSRPDSRLVVTPLYAAYKPRREREKVQMRKENMSGGSEEEEEKEGEGEEEEDDEDFHDEIR
ncbi:hypothetical protein H2203_001913 [Taxawa tesnikishii (nom. ined.)]|nr:hypothetical protein H2203_001913 [Dothideales sp. JES 119]